MTPEIEQAAIAAITRMVANGHAASYIATHLNRTGVPTTTGRGKWGHQTVANFCKTHGIEKPQHNPTRIAEVEAEQAAYVPKEAPPSVDPVKMISGQFTPEEIAEAKAYLEALSDEDKAILDESMSAIHSDVATAEAAVRTAQRQHRDGRSANVGFLKAMVHAASYMSETLQNTAKYVERAEWARMELYLRKHTPPSAASIEERAKTRLELWVDLEQRWAKSEQDRQARVRRVERDPHGARRVTLRSAIKRAQENREKSLAKIARLEQQIANPTPMDSLVLLRNELQGLQWRRAEADRLMAEKVAELEALEALL